MVFAGVALCGAGCGGLGASGSVSPATFLLPGLGQINTEKRPPQAVEQSVDRPASPQVAAHSADLVQ
jgi:hypothetical protein